MIIITPISLNRFDFVRKISFNKNLKLVKHIEYSKFDDNKIKPNKFRVHIYKNDKISSTIKR
jgi:hypothetical protein